MKNLLADYAKQQIKEKIQTELLKRGFTAQIIRFEEKEMRHGGNYISFETEKFQTTPVIFKEMNISNFSTGISEPKIHKSGEKYRLVFIQVDVSYENFEGGTNGSKLFEFRCEVHKKSLYNVRIS